MAKIRGKRSESTFAASEPGQDHGAEPSGSPEGRLSGNGAQPATAKADKAMLAARLAAERRAAELAEEEGSLVTTDEQATSDEPLESAGEPGVDGGRTKDGHPVTGGIVSGLRNLSKRSARKGGDGLELSRSGKASRKSTRKSQGRVKRTTNLQLRAERKTCSPHERAVRKHG